MQTPYLTTTQKAISKLVSDTIGFKWQNYSTADRAVARQLLQRYMAAAPETLSTQEYQKMLEGKKHKRTKAFVATLVDAMEDKVWNVL